MLPLGEGVENTAGRFVCGPETTKTAKHNYCNSCYGIETSVVETTIFHGSTELIQQPAEFWMPRASRYSKRGEIPLPVCLFHLSPEQLCVDRQTVNNVAGGPLRERAMRNESSTLEQRKKPRHV